MNNFKKINLFFFLLGVIGIPVLLLTEQLGILSPTVGSVFFVTFLLAIAIYASTLKCPHCGVRLARAVMQPWSCLVLWYKGMKCWKCKKDF